MTTRAATLPLPACRTLVALALLGVLPGPGLSAEARSRPAGGAASITLEPVPASPPARTKRPVFVCRDDAGVVFADRPCGQVVEARSLDVFVPGPGEVASTSPKPAPAAVRPRVEPESSVQEPSPAETRCVRLRRQLAALDDRMRTGYSARQAAWLWNRWRDIKAQIHESRC